MINRKVYVLLLFISVVFWSNLETYFDIGNKNLTEVFSKSQEIDSTFETLEIVYISPKEAFVFKNDNNEAIVFSSDQNGRLKICFFREKKSIWYNVWALAGDITYQISEHSDEFWNEGYTTLDKKFYDRAVKIILLRNDIDSNNAPSIGKYRRLESEVNSGNIHYSIWYYIE